MDYISTCCQHELDRIECLFSCMLANRQLDILDVHRVMHPSEDRDMRKMSARRPVRRRNVSL